MKKYLYLLYQLPILSGCYIRYLLPCFIRQFEKKIMQNEISLSVKCDHLVLPLRAVGNLENLFSIMVGPRVGYEIFLLQNEL